jgi:hypothetical protein
MSLAYAGTNSAPIDFTGNWSINVGTGQQFGTFTNPVDANVGANDGAGGNPGSLVYWNGTASSGTFATWEASNIVTLNVPEPTTLSLALAGSALILMRRRRENPPRQT